MKQRVLIVNKFYYRRGGDCVCTINLDRLLTAEGHNVAVFAMNYPDNLPSAWSRYWPGEVDFSGGAGAKLKAVGRTLGLGDIRTRFAAILRDFRPDIVHLNNIHSYLSPVVASMAAARGIPVVWTLHDYKLLCPAYSCLRDGKVCELCFADKRQVLSTRCMKGSLAASAVAWLEALRWSRDRLSAATSRFICPSGFMMKKMEQGGFPAEKLTTLCNFIAPEMTAGMERRAASGHSDTREPYMCYVGRLSQEKGVATLLAAAAELPYELRIAGDGPLADELKARYAHCPNIHFLGHLQPDAIEELLASARLSVMPSECYENNPLGVIESLCSGTPVVGAEIGGIPELISPSTGITFASGSKDALKEAIRQARTTGYDYNAIARESLKRFSAATHYSHLIDIYNSL